MKIYFSKSIGNPLANLIARMILVTVSEGIYGIEMVRNGKFRMSRQVCEVNAIPFMMENHYLCFHDENEFLENCAYENTDEHLAGQFIMKALPLESKAFHRFPNITFPDAYEIDFLKNELHKRIMENVIVKMKMDFLGLLEGKYYLGKMASDGKVYIDQKDMNHRLVVSSVEAEIGKI